MNMDCFCSTQTKLYSSNQILCPAAATRGCGCKCFSGLIDSPGVASHLTRKSVVSTGWTSRLCVDVSVRLGV